jgi:acyl carrier protein
MMDYVKIKGVTQMDIKDINKEIKKYVKDRFMNGDANKLTDDKSLFETGIIDSLGVLHLVSFMEQKFNIEVADEEMVPENFETINKLVIFTREKMALARK